LRSIDQPLQEFISSGARLLDLEEQGLFRFWDAEEMTSLISSEYLEVSDLVEAYGDPPQALVVTAKRTETPVQ
jgi:hypothetical protein